MNISLKDFKVKYAMYLNDKETVLPADTNRISTFYESLEGLLSVEFKKNNEGHWYFDKIEKMKTNL